MIRSKLEWWIVGVLALLAALAALFPVWVAQQAAKGNWEGVQPELVADSLYYYAQMQEVADGHPLVGNPYFVERQDEIAPAFFIPVDIAAVPLLLGLSLGVAIFINLLIWNCVFLGAAYQLARELTLRPSVALGTATLIYLSSYMFMLRPVAMQIVFPVFLLFLIALIRWIKTPGKRTGTILAITIAIVPYVYTYLAYIVLFTMGIVFFWILIARNWPRVKELIYIGCAAAVVALPFLILVLLPQLHHEWYAETAERIGLVKTHLPALEAFFYGRWVAITFLAWVIIQIRWKYWKTEITGVIQNPVTLFVFATGMGLFLSLFSNLLTGTDLTIAIHIGRFVILWLSLVLVVLVVSLIEKRRKTLSTIIAALLILVLAAGTLRNIPRTFAFASKSALENVSEIQSYAEPLTWLREHTPLNSVIWSNDQIAEYVPIYTHGYTLFAPAGVLQLDSSKDLIDRYVLSRFQTVSVESLKSDLLLYAGAGKTKEAVRVQHLQSMWCGLMNKVFPRECPPPLENLSLVGEQFFKDIESRSREIAGQKINLLQTYQVNYILIDTAKDQPLSQTIVGESIKLWQNDRFVIYEFRVLE